MQCKSRLWKMMLGLLLATLAAAQVNKSNLTGFVRDATGAAVPAVELRLTNTGTGAVRTTQSDETGQYRFRLLDFGVYRLEVEQEGFKKYIRDGILLETGETTTVDVAMEIGAITESIEVTAESPLLRTETGALGTSVNTRVVNELPLIGRNPYVFLTLSPGIQYTGSPTATNPWDNWGPSNFTSSGSEARSEFLLDGIPNMRIDIVGFSPSPDAVQEMRAQTNTYDAEYGHSGAAFVNVSTKTGTNDLRGNAFWYHRNDNLNANSYFNNRNGRAKSERKQNTYGFSLGGPVTLPKLYDGRDQTHFYVVYEGTQIRSAGYNRAIVPSVLERAGDFSKTTDRSGNVITIFDPASTVPAGNGYVRTPFPGNVIPSASFDPVSAKALKYYPEPNRTPTSTNLENFETIGGSGHKWASISTRGDHQISPNHNLFLRFGWNHRTNPSVPFYGEECCRPAGNPTSGQDIFERANLSAGAGYTWVASPSTVVDFRAGFTRYFEADIMFGEGFDIAQLGFPASFAKSIAFATFPRFEMSGDIENLGAGRLTTRHYINQYNPLVNVHMTLGRHAVKYGFRYQVAQYNYYQPGRAGGFFKFDRAFTQGPDPTKTSKTAGYDFASFLLGTPRSGYTDININPARQNTYYSFYVQDDFKVSPRLTLNLGLRFEHEGPATERFDRAIAGYDFGVTSPLEAGAKANYAQNPIPELASLSVKGGLRFLNVDGSPRGNLAMPALLYAPRFGFAYRVNDWMVWRGGWGIFFTPNNLGELRNDGFSLATNMITSIDGNLTPYHRLRDPFPSGLTNPPGAATGLLTAVGKSITGGAYGPEKVPDYLHGLSQQFSMGFQFVLPWQISVDASYVGNDSQRLTMSRNVNQYPDEFLALKTRLNAKVANPFYGVITDATSSLSQKTTTVQQLLRPFPHFTGLTQSALPYGRGDYHSMQIQFTKRMTQGFYLGAAYTLSKFLEATSYLNANDPAPHRVISNSDRPQRFVVHGIYEMPFGPGKPFLAGANGAARKIVEGWQINWVVTYQSMNPLDFSDAIRLSRSENNPRTVDQWFDVSQFAPVEPFTLRTLPLRLSDLRAQCIRKWDLTVMKKIAITERVQMRLLGEFYNAWNTTHFSGPNTNVTNKSFGFITGTFLGPREVQLVARLHW